MSYHNHWFEEFLFKENRFKHCDGCIIDSVCKDGCEKYMKIFEKNYNSSYSFSIASSIIRRQRDLYASLRIMEIKLPIINII